MFYLQKVLHKPRHHKVSLICFVLGLLFFFCYPFFFYLSAWEDHWWYITSYAKCVIRITWDLLITGCHMKDIFPCLYKVFRRQSTLPWYELILELGLHFTFIFCKSGRMYKSWMPAVFVQTESRPSYRNCNDFRSKIKKKTSGLIDWASLSLVSQRYFIQGYYHMPSHTKKQCLQV